MPAIRVTLNVQGANAKNATIVYGHPSPFAAIGFVHALCLKTGMKQTTGTLFVFHKYSDRGAKIFGKFYYDMLRSAERDAQGLTQLDIPRSDMRVSVLFEADSPDLDAIKSAVASMRFAGGVITTFAIAALGSMDEAVAACPGGFVMREHNLPDQGDALTALLDTVTIGRGRRGWVTPSLRGFRLLEEPKQRKGSRAGYLHAYADPLIGTVSFESIRKAPWRQCLWNIDRIGDLILFTARG